MGRSAKYLAAALCVIGEAVSATCSLAQAQASAKPQIPMTKRQGKELLDSVDNLMGFVSTDTGLRAVAHVKRRLISKEEVAKYLVQNFEEDESAKRLQRSEIVLKKFGLLAQDFNLKPFLLSLLTEQIAGFYDAKTKTVNLLDWIEPEEQEPVLAHELTHALQDQRVDLENWSKLGYKGVSNDVAEDTRRVASDEMETARQAVTEGQAMLVFLDWSLKDSGKTLAESPEVWDKVKNSIADANDSALMARAPLLLQRSLEFPYVDGLRFEHALSIQPGGKQLAFAGVLARPPTSSYEVMNPQAFLAHTPVPAVQMPDVHQLLDTEYEPYDIGVMGALDVEMMSSLFGGPEIAAALAPQWDGGIYYAAQRRSSSFVQKTGTASLAVFYFSRWKNPEAATGFSRIYEAELGRKYTNCKEVKSDELDSREKVFETNEGKVLISRSGDDLFITEGFSLESSRKLRSMAEDVQGSGPLRQAAGSELTLGVISGLRGFGLLAGEMNSHRSSASVDVGQKAHKE